MLQTRYFVWKLFPWARTVIEVKWGMEVKLGVGWWTSSGRFTLGDSCFPIYEGVSKSFRTESITKYILTKVNTRWEATQRVMAAKLTRLTHQMAIQVHLVAESCTICNSRSRRPVRKFLDTPTCTGKESRVGPEGRSGCGGEGKDGKDVCSCL
jgi:hypothetical protein